MSESDSMPVGFHVVPGYPRYAIDENGTVLSVCGKGFGAGINRQWSKARRVKPCTRHGYYCVCLSRDGHAKHISVHKLVLETFVGPCPDGMQCRHLDGNKANNHKDNLAWGTPLENSCDKVLHGTSYSGEKCGKSKLKDADVLAIRTRAKNGERHADIARDFPVHKDVISRIVRRETWKHI